MLPRPATAVVAALALLATACGDDETATTPDATTPDTITPGTTTPGTTTPGTTAPAGDEMTADLTIMYEHAEAGVVFEYGIECGPDSSEVTGAAEEAEIDASSACAALAEPAVVERLVEGPPEDQICTEIYGGADIARISGTISGEEVDTKVDRTNGCGIADWDDLLDPILPPAIGVVPESG